MTTSFTIAADYSNLENNDTFIVHTNSPYAIILFTEDESLENSDLNFIHQDTRIDFKMIFIEDQSLEPQILKQAKDYYRKYREFEESILD